MKKQPVLEEINDDSDGKVNAGKYDCHPFDDPLVSCIHEGSKISDPAFTSFCFMRNGYKNESKKNGRYGHFFI